MVFVSNVNLVRLPNCSIMKKQMQADNYNNDISVRTYVLLSSLLLFLKVNFDIESLCKQQFCK